MNARPPCQRPGALPYFSKGATGKRPPLRKRPERDGATGRFDEEQADMPDGLVKVIIIGCVGFFFGAAIIGWVYG